MAKLTKEHNLAVKNPELAKEWHPTKNGDLTPYDVTPGSGKEVLWKCKNCNNNWPATIANRNKGKGCPKCNNLTKLGPKNPKLGESLGEKNPQLANEWHPTKNLHPVTKKILTPYDVTPGSRKKVWWICSKGHKWLAQIKSRTSGTRCPYCYDNESLPCARIRYELKIIFDEVKFRETIYEQECDIYLPKFKLGIEYDGRYYHGGLEKEKKRQKKEFEKTLNKKDILEKNNIYIIFVREEPLGSLCDSDIIVKNPYQKDIELFNTIKTILNHKKLNKSLLSEIENKRIKNYLNRDYKNDGYINNKEFFDFQKNGIDKKESLKFLNPSLANEWHHTKNGDLTPRHVTTNSNQKVWWKCKVCTEEWLSSPSNRNKSGCPYCANKKAGKYNNLAVKNPKLAKEWHPTKNGDLTPYDVTPVSGKKVWWQCSKNKDHEWPATVANRSKEVGCPYCSGRNSTKENNLAVKNPELANEWHPTKNGDLTPYDVTPNSGKKVWWICNKNKDHEWPATVSHRSNGTNCPKCFKEKRKYKWRKNYDLLAEFIKLHNQFPKYDSEIKKEKTLYNWIYHQKLVYKNNELSQEQIRLLKEIEIIT